MPPGTSSDTHQSRLSKLQALASRSRPQPGAVAGGGRGAAGALPRPGARAASHAPSAPFQAHGSSVGAAAPARAVAQGAATHQEALAQNARLEGANRQLRERLQDALQELDAAHAQLRILSSLQQQLEAGTPGATDLAAVALEQERALQAARDAQVLQLLRSKDEVIESFEARYAESRAEAAQYREQLEAAQAQLANSQLRVAELVESKARLRQQVDQAAAEGADGEAQLRRELARLEGEVAKCEPLRQQVQGLEQQLAAAKADLAAAHRQLATLSDTVDAANDAIVEVQGMLTEREQLAAERGAEVEALQQHLAQLLGMPQSDVPLLHRARFGGPGARSSSNGQEQGLDVAAASRIAALEAANERLELALVEATRGATAALAAATGDAATGAAGAKALHADSEDAELVGVLEAKLAMATGQLRAAEERVQQLEKLLKVAEATVLHNEVQLQDALEGRMRAEEQVLSLRLELEDGQALLAQLKATLGQLAASEQAAKEEVAAVRGALQAASMHRTQQQTQHPHLTQQQGQQQQQQQQHQQGDAAQQEGQHAGSSSAAGACAAATPASLTVPPAASAAAHTEAAPGATISSQQPGSLGHEVGSAVGALLEQIQGLEQQVARQQQQLQEAQQAAAATNAAAAVLEQHTVAAAALAAQRHQLTATVPLSAQQVQAAALAAVPLAAEATQEQPAAAVGAAAPLAGQEQQGASAPPQKVAVQAVGVQCELPLPATAAVQVRESMFCGVHTDAEADKPDQQASGTSLSAAAAANDAATTAAAAPTAAAVVDGHPALTATTYGRADAQQQQMAELTAQLAAARLAEVAAKAGHAALEARLHEAERQLEEQQVALRAARKELAEEGASTEGITHATVGCSCPAAQALQADCEELQAEVTRLGSCLSKAQREGEAQLAQAVAAAQAQQQALQAQLSALEGGKCELSELRSSAYVTVHRLQQALREHGAALPALATLPPEGCGPESLPQQMKQAVDALLAMLQEHSELVAAFQQHMQQQQPSAAPCMPGSSSVGGGLLGDLSLEASQRQVIRSLAAQVADLQGRLEEAAAERRQHLHERGWVAAPQGQAKPAEGPPPTAGGLGTEPSAWQLPARQVSQVQPPGNADAAQLVGMLVLLKQQLAGLERVQQQLAAGGSGSPASGGNASGAAGLVPSAAAHAAAVLGTELPALQATVGVLEAQLRHVAAAAAAAAAAAGACAQPGLSSTDTGWVLCLPAPASASASAPAPTDLVPADLSERKDKWKARCRELQAQLAAADAAAQQAEAALLARVAEAERAAAEQAAQQAATVQALQERVEELATAGMQLESTLQETANQLTEAAVARESLRQQLDEQQRRHQVAMQAARSRLADAEATLEQEQQQHASLVSTLKEMVASLQSSGDTEGQLRSQVAELAERVAVLTAAQEAAKTETEHKGGALSTVQRELENARAVYAELAAEKQRREGELVGRLEALQRECSTLLGAVERAEEQHAEVEQRLQSQVALLHARLDRHGDEAVAHLPPLSAALGRLQESAEGMEVRLLRLEAAAAVALEDRQVAAAGQWAALVRSRRYRAAVQQLRDGLQARLLDAEANCQQQAVQLRQLGAALEAARAECAELQAQSAEVAAAAQHQLQQAGEERQHDVEALRQQAEERARELMERADAAAAEAVAEVEQQCRLETAARVAQAEQRAVRDLEAAEEQCALMQAELEAVQREFCRYQQMKGVEVKLLEQRVLQQMRGGSSGGGRTGGAGVKHGGRVGAGQPSGSSGSGRSKFIPAVRPGGGGAAGGGGDGGSGSSGGSPVEGQTPVTLSDLQAACGQEGIAAALREASLERMQREQVEAELAAAREAGEQLGARAKAAEQELAAMRSRQAGEARLVRERAERLAAELEECQQALRVAKAEGARRLKDLQALQRQAASGAAVANENGGANGVAGATGAAAVAAVARLEGEHAAREVAEAQLREMRQALARKAALIRDLRAKVGELEQELAARDPAPLLGELEACQARLRQAQAACGSKDAAVRELRERLEQQTRLAHQQGALEEREQQEAAVSHLRRELAERDAHVARLHQQLQQVHHELAAASAGLQTAAASQSAEVEGATAQAATARHCAQQLLQAVRLLLDTLVQMGAAVAAAAHQAGLQTESQAGAEAEAIAAAASLVGLAPEDIRSVLMPAPTAQPTAAAAAAASSVQAAGQQAWVVLQQVEAQLGAGAWQGAALASLLAAVGQLQEACLRSQATLAAAAQQQAVSAAGQACAGGGAGLAFEDLEQRLRAAAAEVADLEARMR